MTTLVSVDRTSLSLSALALTDLPVSSGFWVVTMGRPSMTRQNVYATSPWVDGSLLIDTTLNQTTLSLSLYGVAATTSALNTLAAALTTAFSQFNYATTVTIDSQNTVWSCDPADITWNDAVKGEADQFLIGCSLSIPAYPVSS